MQNIAQVVSVTKSPIAKEKTLAQKIVSDLYADGLLPFKRVALTDSEAKALGYYLTDAYADWGSSGALAPPDLQSEPCWAPGSKPWQPRVPSLAGDRARKALAMMSPHEHVIIVWLHHASRKRGISLAKAGAEWGQMRYRDDDSNAALATGMLSLLCRTLMRAYRIDNYEQNHPGGAQDY